jgi:hypothetical protein
VPVGVLVGATHPRTCRVGEEHPVLQILADVPVVGQLAALVPGQRVSGHDRQLSKRGDERIAYRSGVVPGG